MVVELRYACGDLIRKTGMSMLDACLQDRVLLLYITLILFNY